MSRDDHRRLGIPEDVARSEHVPDDLDATQREPYTIPSTRRRRTGAVVYALGAAFAAAAVVAGAPVGLLVLTGIFVALFTWHLASSWPIGVLDPEALETANREVPFPVGHASAVVGFDGWRARPVWNVLVFDAEDPPSRRGLVRVDAVDGHVVETYWEGIRGQASDTPSKS